ncbi:hypothetical protein Taro_054731 [Colocasia esculenta]|uniref:Uncharacterized protein n=1 Tax=Colocasia esculenta TaxID=4460 RepID=A0A843XS43_COLES|nr:hypothetical protein [Colocasia esculenta]
MVAIVGAKEGGPVDEVVEQVGDLEQAGVVAWGCGLCQGHLPAAAAAVVVAVADTIVGRVGTVVVVAAAAVVVVAAAVASAVAAVASDPVGLSMRESKGIQGHEGCKDIGQRLRQRRILGSFGSIGLSGGIAILRRRNLGVLALVVRRVLTLGRLLPVVIPWLLRLLGVGVALEINSLTFSSSGMGQRTLAASERHRSA